MSATLLSFIVIVLFMIHEFEEIIWVLPWIEKQSDNPIFANQIFIRGKANYPSSETLAFLILEEFILASLALLFGILFSRPEIIVAITVGHSLHLLIHLSELIRYQTWVPGTISAVLTLPILFITLYLFLKSHPTNWIHLVTWTLVTLFIILINLFWLHSQSEKVERWLHR